MTLPNQSCIFIKSIWIFALEYYACTCTEKSMLNGCHPWGGGVVVSDCVNSMNNT